MRMSPLHTEFEQLLLASKKGVAYEIISSQFILLASVHAHIS